MMIFGVCFVLYILPDNSLLIIKQLNIYIRRICNYYSKTSYVDLILNKCNYIIII